MRVPSGLRVPGYTDVDPDGADWWCFDVPPGWREWTDRPLVEVCAFQWRAAHEATLRTVERLGLDYHRVRFEDVVGTSSERRAALEALVSWIGLDAADAAALARRDLPVVMATAPPRPGRWRQRTALIEPVVTDGQTLGLATRLGYGADLATWR
ncbi:MAG TPA: hypothetical protein VM324_05725 [Egibacteraceae bacterium]|nr:hypothetical protein [Egibacteraceae bacterium]